MSPRAFQLVPNSVPCAFGDSPTPRPSIVVGENLLHRAALVAVTILLANDHLLKGVGPGWLTGKLSDVAGLVFFPLLLQAFAELATAGLLRRWPRTRARWLLPVCCALTALLFALIKLWPPAASFYCHVAGALQWPFRSLFPWLTGGDLGPVKPVALVMDPTDLLALPAVLVAWRQGAVVPYPR